MLRLLGNAGWSSPVARQAHNLKVVGSNPTPATNNNKGLPLGKPFVLCHNTPYAFVTHFCALTRGRKMTEIQHTIMGGKVHVFKRPRSNYWQCSAFIQGKNRRKSTKEESLQHAKQFAEDWYLELRGKSRAGLLKDEKTFKQVADQFLKEYGVITEGQRSPKWVEGHAIRLRVHLNPFFGNLAISDVTSAKVQEYRVHRMTPQDNDVATLFRTEKL